MPGGGLTYAKAEILTPYGKVISDWKIENGQFKLTVQVPVSATCYLTLPDGTETVLTSGIHDFVCESRREAV